MDGIVFPVGWMTAPVHPVGGNELVVELGRKRKGLSAKHLSLKQRERIPLLLRLDHLEGRGGAGIPLVAPRCIEAANEPRGRIH